MKNVGPVSVRALSRDEVRGVDERSIQEFGLPGIALMENAGSGAARVLLELGVCDPVVILAGKGNNGGDGFVIARHLELAGLRPVVLLIARREEVQGDARVNLEVALSAGIRVVETSDPVEVRACLRDSTWVIDAILGTGARGAAREPVASILSEINGADHAKIVAIDLPTGLDCDAGPMNGDCVRADHTITFVAPKLGFAVPGASEFLGQVYVVDIGAPLVVLQPFLNEQEKTA